MVAHTDWEVDSTTLLKLGIILWYDLNWIMPVSSMDLLASRICKLLITSRMLLYVYVWVLSEPRLSQAFMWKPTSYHYS